MQNRRLRQQEQAAKPGVSPNSLPGFSNQQARDLITSPKQMGMPKSGSIGTTPNHRRGNGSVGARLTNQRSSPAKPLILSAQHNQHPQGIESRSPMVNRQAAAMMDSASDNRSSMGSAGNFVNLLYMEDFDPEVDPDFIKKELKPYFSGVFADLALRSTQSQSIPQRSIDKVTFVEYVNLPGIVSDRFHALASKGQPDGRIFEQSFIDLMLQVFSSSVETKMRLTFQM